MLGFLAGKDQTYVALCGTFFGNAYDGITFVNNTRHSVAFIGFGL